VAIVLGSALGKGMRARVRVQPRSARLGVGPLPSTIAVSEPSLESAIFGSMIQAVAEDEERYRYSNTFGWNTFPVSTLTDRNKTDLTRCAEDILLAREAHFPATIADLYNPETMPENLRRAHDRNDETLERIYIGRRFKNDTERLEKLFELYTKMTDRPAAKQPAKRKTKRGK
jgi:hypothetical protein